MAPSSIRPRAALLGLGLGIGLCLLTPYNNVYLNGPPLGGGHFPMAPFAAFLLLGTAAALWRRTGRAPLLTGLELLTVWALTALVAGVGHTGLFRTFFISLAAPLALATPGNRWSEILGPILPRGLFLDDPAAARLLFVGLENGAALGWTEVLARIPWTAWTGPLLAWGLFVLLAWLVMLCLVSLLGRQWIVNERMNFPLMRAPLALGEALDRDRWLSFLADRWLLVGFFLAALLHVVNGLAFHWPFLPRIPTLVPVGEYAPATGLLSGFQKLKMHIVPAFIGFAFLTSRQISLSLWLFFLLGGLLAGGLAASGLQATPAGLSETFGPTLSRPEETQTIGAYVVFFLFLLWLARFHLRHAGLAALGLAKSEAASGEQWLGPGPSLWGALLGFAGLVLWCVHFGLGLVSSVVVLGAFFLFMIVTVRAVCQGGIPYYALAAAPLDGVIGWLGSGFLGGVGLVLAAAVQKALFVDARESVMPAMLQAAKAGEPGRSRRLFFAAVCLTLVGGLLAAGAAMLALCHKYGLRQMEVEWAVGSTQDVYESVRRLAETPGGPWGWLMAYSALGAAVMAVLVICYQRLPWWPLHPIGYLAAYGSAMQMLWFSFLVGWFCNHLVWRYGGAPAFDRARALFIGLIIGDHVMAALFAAYGFQAGASYQVLPN